MIFGTHSSFGMAAEPRHVTPVVTDLNGALMRRAADPPSADVPHDYPQ
jgi:hypothetical protein